MNRFTRRDFLQRSSAALAFGAIPLIVPWRAARGADAFQRWLDHMPSPGSAELQAVLQAGLDAAKQAGAVYADAAFRVTRREQIHGDIDETILGGVGIRALYKGYWGFAGTDGIATADTAARLGRDAVALAKIAAQGTPRTIELAPTPVARGTWTMPVEIDPFTVSRGEKRDVIDGIFTSLRRDLAGVMYRYGLDFVKEERTYASTDGTFTAQTVYLSSCYLELEAERHFRSGREGRFYADFLTPAGAGWEYVLRAPYAERIPQAAEHAIRARHGKPVDIGRYDVVFDAYAVAGIVNATLGPATELERAIGYRANDRGTSFLAEPLEMLGAFQTGSPLVNVSATRSMPGGAATVQWDEDGVAPRDTMVVTNGKLTDFQTTRELASWLAPYYQRAGKPVASSGGAGREKAGAPPSQCASDLVLRPGSASVTLDELIADTKHGYAVLGGRVEADSQALNGEGSGLVYEIRNGKLGDVVIGSSYLLRTPEFWNSVVALGGPQSAGTFGFWRRDGLREYRSARSVAAVPVKVTGLRMIDTTRQA